MDVNVFQGLYYNYICTWKIQLLKNQHLAKNYPMKTKEAISLKSLLQNTGQS